MIAAFLSVALSIPPAGAPPPVAAQLAAQGFPGPKETRAKMRAAEEFVDDMKGVREWDFPENRRVWSRLIREGSHRFFIWNTLDDLYFADLDACYRWEQLDNLRRLLGDEAFYRGQMPGHLPPLWLFPVRP